MAHPKKAAPIFERHLQSEGKIACGNKTGMIALTREEVTCKRCRRTFTKVEKKPRHLKLLQPEIDDRVPTILCGNAKLGDTSTQMINSKYAPVTCEGCLLMMREREKKPARIEVAITAAETLSKMRDHAALAKAVYVDNEPLEDMCPDWEQTWTAEKAEAELSGFKFKGLGWYVTKDSRASGTGSGKVFDALLVLPWGMVEGWDEAGKRMGEVGTKLYKFYVYNGRVPFETFNWILNAPMRQDERA